MSDTLTQRDFKIKKDNYRRVRGGTTKVVELACSNCGFRVMVYQKDGVGRLRRTYLDRILFPANLANLAIDPKIRNVKDMTPLKCDACGALLGVPMIYKPEHRLAFRLKWGALVKHVLD